MNIKQVSIAIIGAILGFTIQACASEQLSRPTVVATNTAAVTHVPTQDQVIVGLSFPDSYERWKKEEIHMRALLEEKGYEVISREANHDVKLQNDQINDMVVLGAKAIIVIAEDGDTAVTAVENAAEEGVLIIAYDRLIKSADIAAYVSFSSYHSYREVGRQQALGVLAAVDIEGGEWTVDNPLKLVKLGGSPTASNAFSFRKGQDEIIDPYVEAGKIEIVADQWVEQWDPANAYVLMGQILATQNNEIDAVLAMNDRTALGALDAMREQGLAGVVPISGADATAKGCNSIVKGELTVTTLKSDYQDLSVQAIDLVDAMLKGEDVELVEYTLTELAYDHRLRGSVMTYFPPVEQVNIDNVYELVVLSGFQSYDDVYIDIPEDERPPVPGDE
jgi:D-xylose transport system substrate-binding protein